MAETSLQSARLRVLVVLDPSAPRSEVLEAVACLAGDRSAHVTGLFIEDAELLSLARLPFAREVRHAGSLVAFEAEELMQSLERQAREVRRIFEQTSSALKLAASFRIVRGNVLEELQRAAQEADLLLIGRAGPSSGPRNWQRQIIGRLPAATRKPVVFVQKVWRSGRSVVAYYEPDQQGRATLEQAVRIANIERAPLVVLVASGNGERRRRHDAEEELTTLGASARIETIEPIDDDALPGPLERLLRREDARVLVVPSGQLQFDEEALSRLLDRLECSLVAVPEAGE